MSPFVHVVILDLACNVQDCALALAPHERLTAHRRSRVGRTSPRERAAGQRRDIRCGLKTVRARGSQVEAFEDRPGGFRFRLKAANGEVVAIGDSYTTRWGSREGCVAVKAEPQRPRLRTSS